MASGFAMHGFCCSLPFTCQIKSACEFGRTCCLKCGVLEKFADKGKKGREGGKAVCQFAGSSSNLSVACVNAVVWSSTETYFCRNILQNTYPKYSAILLFAE